jgi:flagellar hook-associated protein 2
MAITSSTNAPAPAPTKAGAGAAIISSLGSGSGIDTAGLINKLTDVSKYADQTRLTTKQTLLETQISDFGLLRSSFSALEGAMASLSSADTFNAKSVSVPTTNLLSITKIDASAAAGNYSINVEQIAKAQSISSDSYASQTAPVGKGTLSIRFGSWNAGVDTFTANATQTGGTIKIDDSNNSLAGVRDAINNAKLGITASIVSDGGSFKLLVAGPSGETNEIEITATEAPGSTGLANFNFNEATRNLTQQQAGQDALIRVNGLALTRSSNHLTDVIPGLEFDLTNSSLTEVVNIGITADKSFAEKAIRDFVAAYNKFLTDSDKLIGFDSEKQEYGSLRQDPLAKSLVQQVRNQLSAPIVGLNSTFPSFSSLGIRTELGSKGTLQIDDSNEATSFRSTIDNHFEAVRDLFVPKLSSDNAQITLTKSGVNSTPGTYPVEITQQPTKATLTGMTMVGGFPLDTTGKTYTFTAGVDGFVADPITLPERIYTSGAELAADIQTRINSDAKITAGKVTVSVVFNAIDNRLEFTSNAFGSTSNVSLSELSTDMADLGAGPLMIRTMGTDVAGTIGGVAAFGYGDVLLPAIGSKAEGLSMRVTPGATSGNITFSRGFAGSFTSLINNFLKTNGLIKTHEKEITQQVDKVKVAQTALDKRSEAYRARLQAQFSAMESIVRGLKSTGTFLTGAFKALSGNNDN